MLKLYGPYLSTNVRRVWVALLEKGLAFEPCAVKLAAESPDPDLVALNPFQLVPVLVDDDFRVIESLAILDYLEAKYPAPPLLPTDPQALATVRMIEMVAVNELQPALMDLTRQFVGLTVAASAIARSQARLTLSLQFLESRLSGGPFYLGETLTRADVVAGTLVVTLPMLGEELAAYPKLLAWSDRLAERPSWQATTPKPVELATALPMVRKILERRA